MLEITSRLSVRPKQPRRHLDLPRKTSPRQPAARAKGYLAAHWVLGSMTIVNPTIRLASYIFNVSIPTIRTAVAELKVTTDDSEPTALGRIWSSMTPAERSAFARDDLSELRAAFERATAAVITGAARARADIGRRHLQPHAA